MERVAGEFRVGVEVIRAVTIDLIFKCYYCHIDSKKICVTIIKIQNYYIFITYYCHTCIIYYYIHIL